MLKKVVKVGIKCHVLFTNEIHFKRYLALTKKTCEVIFLHSTQRILRENGKYLN